MIDTTYSYSLLLTSMYLSFEVISLSSAVVPCQTHVSTSSSSKAPASSAWNPYLAYIPSHSTAPQCSIHSLRSHCALSPSNVPTSAPRIKSSQRVHSNIHVISRSISSSLSPGMMSTPRRDWHSLPGDEGVSMRRIRQNMVSEREMDS